MPIAARHEHLPIRVVGFPPAGVGASFFEPVRRCGLDVVGVDLPGRESRAAEPACGTLTCAVDEAAAHVDALLRAQPDAGLGLVLAGHSFGAVVAWLVATRVADTAGSPSVVLVVSGAPSPSRRRVPLAHLPDKALVSAVARLTGYSHPAYEDPRMRRVLLPALRADLTCLMDLPQRANPLDACVVVVRGAQDPLVSRSDTLGWQAISRNPVEEMVVPGGHMHPFEDPSSYAQVLIGVVDALSQEAWHHESPSSPRFALAADGGGL